MFAVDDFLSFFKMLKKLAPRSKKVNVDYAVEGTET